MISSFHEYSLPGLIDMIGSGKLTCVELADSVVEMVGRYEDDVHAWVEFDAARIRKNAILADSYYQSGANRRLEGIPFGIKDIFNTCDYPTQMGSPIWSGFTPGNNARVVDSLVQSGASIAGKTVTAEFAVHELNETRNPHNLARTPGTSSSGSAAAVASGMIPFALASQTAGSIIRPASFCGVWGMKPSFGMIPRTGVLKTTDSLDTIGFIAAMGESLRLILDICRVKGPDYPFVYRNVDKRGSTPKSISKPWRVGFVKAHTWNHAANDVRSSIEGLASRIEAEPDFVVDELFLPERVSYAHQVHQAIYNKSLSYYFQHEVRDPSMVSSIMAEIIALGEEVSNEQFLSALHEQESICDDISALFENYDLVISNSTASSAPLREERELPDPSLMWTLAHVPVVGVPAFEDEFGLPFGAQFTSAKWNDYLLLQGVEALIERDILPRGSSEIRRYG